MRLIDEPSLNALEGSRPADTVTAWAWRGGSLVLPDPLEVIDWSLSDEAGDAVKIGQKMTLTVADPDGSLGAWRLDDPLGVAGTRVQIIERIGGAGTVNTGWFRIIGNTPKEVIETRIIDEYGYSEPDGDLPEHKRRVMVVRAVVTLDLVDLTFNADQDKLEAPQSPPAGAMVISEFKRLTARHFPTVVDDGVSNKSVSKFLVYDRERLEAGQDLLSRVGARYRMGGDGECHIYPRITDPVLTVEPTAGLIEVSRKQTVDGLYNRWVVEGKDGGDGKPVRGVASINSGPLRYDGPHGRSQYSYSSEMITSRDEAEAYARQLRQEFLSSLAVELNVSMVPRPELQSGDWIRVGCPIAAGHVIYIPGMIASLSRAGTPVPGPMSLKVQCSYADVVEALGRTDWAEHLTGEIPELTWDRMPGNWGTAPAMPWNDLP